MTVDSPVSLLGERLLLLVLQPSQTNTQTRFWLAMCIRVNMYTETRRIQVSSFTVVVGCHS